VLEQLPSEKEPVLRKVPKDFKGELLFNSALLSVTNPQRLLACFLAGDGEHSPDSADENNGYLKFATLLEQNNIEWRKLSLAGTNQIPLDCNLLVIAGPIEPIPQPELDKIGQYLNEGGRLFALFNNYFPGRKFGLEKILANWGVEVGNNIVKDSLNTTSGGQDLLTSEFGGHPMLGPVLGSRLQMVLPRSISKSQGKLNADAPKVDELVFTSENGRTKEADGSVKPTGSIPLMAAVEKGNIKGVFTQRGLTRIVVAGDSLFLNNHMIVAAANQDFADCAINWLLDQTGLMQGVGPRPVTEYRISMNRSQAQSVRWLLLAGMPGVILLLGGLVWLRRRY
ncbi:MAG TPA: Gldg family protein, partial [Verrucomicrobiae bacterium]|nr:Gldg family protein [Verrucomicrobiae bacterium]